MTLSPHPNSRTNFSTWHLGSLPAHLSTDLSCQLAPSQNVNELGSLPCLKPSKAFLCSWGRLLLHPRAPPHCPPATSGDVQVNRAHLAPGPSHAHRLLSLSTVSSCLPSKLCSLAPSPGSVPSAFSPLSEVPAHINLQLVFNECVTWTNYCAPPPSHLQNGDNSF